VILPDVNVLVFAFRREAANHERYAAWLGEVAGGADDLALTDLVTVGFMWVVTNPRIFADPAPMATALDLVDGLRAGPRTRWLPHTDAAWDTYRAVAASDRGVRGNLVPDAWLASLALAHGCRIATADKGFARFDGVETFDPGL